MEKCKPTQKQEKNALSLPSSERKQYTTLFEGMELVEPVLVRLPNGMEVVRLPENGIQGLFAVTSTPCTPTVEHIDRGKRVAKRRPTWSERGKTPPWNNHET